MTEQEAGKVKGFLGLCQRAGQVVLGQDACIDTIRKGLAAVVLLDDSSTEVSKKRFRNACTSHHVPIYGVPEGLIEQATGKDGRRAAAIRHGTMAKKLEELMGKPAMVNSSQNDNDTNERADIAGVQAII